MQFTEYLATFNYKPTTIRVYMSGFRMLKEIFPNTDIIDVDATKMSARLL